MDYDTLIADKNTPGSIANWTNYGKLPAASIVSFAESWIYSRLRTREMLSLANGTINLGAKTLDVSTLSVLEPVVMRRIGDLDSGPITLIDPEHFESRTYFDSNDNPVMATPTEAMLIGGTFHLNTLSDKNYRYRLVYFGRPAPLATSGTNFLTERYDALLLDICLYYAYRHMKDRAAAADALQTGMNSIEEANREMDMASAAQQFAHFWEDY